MFEKFGEFDSIEELNRAAAAQKEEGDLGALKILAAENGIDKEDAVDYMDGVIESLATPAIAAMGKLSVEAEDLKLGGILSDWKDYIGQLCMEDEELCHAVRRKGRSLCKCIGCIMKNAFETKQRIDDRIVKEAGLRAPMYIGIPGRAEVRKIVRNYYMGGKA